MKINLTQLSQQKSLAKIYLISSNEPLLCNEAVEKIILSANKENFHTIERWYIDGKFSWKNFLTDFSQNDLFSEKKILILQLNTLKIGNQGSEAIIDCIAQQTTDKLIIIVSEKLDNNNLKSKWVNTIDEHGCIVQLWPPERSDLPKWIMHRLAQHHLTISSTAAQLIADNSEGNLLATQQNINRLFLEYGSGTINDEQVHAVVYDSSHYNVFNLVDSWLDNDLPRTLKILAGLKTEGNEAILILWALARECRLLATIQFERQSDPSIALNQLFDRHKIWKSRFPLLQKHLQQSHDYMYLLQQLTTIEKIIKGIQQGNPWEKLTEFIVEKNFAAA